MRLVFLLLTAAAFAADPSYPPGHPVAASAPPEGAAPTPVYTRHGTVLETMDAGGYTFVRVSGDGGEYWAAGPELAVKVGDLVMLSQGIEMTNFYSRSLDRTFPSVWFVGGLATGQIEASLSPAPAPAPVTLLSPPTGGYGIVDLYARAASLAGQRVKVRGRVVRASDDIMGRNWLHLQDGTGSADGHTNDLVVTTSARVRVGDVVTVEGSVAADKDFGAGYRFAVMLEEAKVVVE